MGETVGTVADFIFLGSKITADGDCNHEIKRRLLLGRKVMTNLDSILKSRATTLLTKVCIIKGLDFPVVIYGCELGYKESWAPKNWCFWTVVLEKMLKSAMDCKETKPVNPKRNQSWTFSGRTDVETEALILWNHHQLNGYEFEKAPEMMKDREAWHAAAHGVTKSWTEASDWTTTTLRKSIWKSIWNQLAYLSKSGGVLEL